MAAAVTRAAALARGGASKAAAKGGQAAKSGASKAAKATKAAPGRAVSGADVALGVVGTKALDAVGSAASKPAARVSSYAEVVWQGVGTMIALGLVVLVLRSAAEHPSQIQGAVEQFLHTARKFVNPFGTV